MLYCLNILCLCRACCYIVLNIKYIVDCLIECLLSMVLCVCVCLSCYSFTAMLSSLLKLLCRHIMRYLCLKQVGLEMGNCLSNQLLLIFSCHTNMISVKSVFEGMEFSCTLMSYFNRFHSYFYWQSWHSPPGSKTLQLVVRLFTKPTTDF